MTGVQTCALPISLLLFPSHDKASMQEAFENVEEKDIVFAEAVHKMIDKLQTEEGMYKVFCDTVVPHINLLNKTEQKSLLSYVKGASLFQKVESAGMKDYLDLVAPPEVEPSSLN